MSTLARPVGLFTLPPELEDLRASVRAFAEDRLRPLAAGVDEAGVFARESHDLLVAAGLHAPGIPQEFGGDGADPLAAAVMIEEVARVCASSCAVLTSNALGTVPLLAHGTAEQRQRYLPQVASGEALMAYALSEREAGSDVSAMLTRASEVHDGYVLDGVKSWVTSAGVARYLIVFAVTDPGEGSRSISAFVLHADDPGISYGEPERKMGLRGSVTREVILERVHVPADRLLGRRGRGLHIALGTLDHTRVSVGAEAVGIGQGALDAAVAYVKEREQFGQAVAQFQGVQFMLADMSMRMESARQMVYGAASRSAAGSADLTWFGAAAKCIASDAAMSVTTDAVQLFGGAGYVRDNPVERMMRDAKITQIYEGTNQIQRVVIARHLLA